MSFWTKPIDAAKNVVKPPKNTIRNNEIEENSNRKEHRAIKKTPAVTNVAACNKAETGVGASIASGNQVCKPIWADLPTTPKNRNKEIMSIIEKSKAKNEKDVSAKKGAKTKTRE